MASGWRQSVRFTLNTLHALPFDSEHPQEIFDFRELLTTLTRWFTWWALRTTGQVRGLAYYTGVVFECFDRRGELRAICGGGRYDRLLSLYGAETTVPACGFGFGDCVIIELLKDLDKMPVLEKTVR